MRKRIFAALLAAALLLCAGCGGQKNAPGFGEEDLTLTVGGSTYRIQDNIETVLSQLGDGYEYSEGRSCAYDGLDKTYIYPAAEFYTHPLPEGDLIGEIYSKSGEASTSKGIKVGSKKADVVAAYGEPTGGDEYLLIYQVSQEPGNPALCFEMEGDAVDALQLTAEPM